MKTIKRYVSLGLTLIRMGWQSQISYMGFSALLSYVAQIIQFAGVLYEMGKEKKIHPYGTGTYEYLYPSQDSIA